MISDEQLERYATQTFLLSTKALDPVYVLISDMATELLQLRAEKRCLEDTKQAEVDALRANIERLKALGWKMTSDEELKVFSDLHKERIMITTDSLNGMADEILKFRTENERLKAPQKVLKAGEVTGPGWYWWRLEPGHPWQIKNIRRRYIPSTNQWVMILCGQFIGPINTPEVE